MEINKNSNNSIDLNGNYNDIKKLTVNCFDAVKSFRLDIFLHSKFIVGTKHALLKLKSGLDVFVQNLQICSNIKIKTSIPIGYLKL